VQLVISAHRISEIELAIHRRVHYLADGAVAIVITSNGFGLTPQAAAAAESNLFVNLAAADSRNVSAELVLLHRDHIASVVALTTAGGDLIESRSYSAFGEVDSSLLTANANKHQLASANANKHQLATAKGFHALSKSPAALTHKYPFSKLLKHISLFVSTDLPAYNDANLRAVSRTALRSGDDNHLLPVIDLGYRNQEDLRNVALVRFSRTHGEFESFTKDCYPEDSVQDTAHGRHCAVRPALLATASHSRLYDPSLVRFLSPFPIDLLLMSRGNGYPDQHLLNPYVLLNYSPLQPP